MIGVGSGGGPPACIPLVPTPLPPALNCASQVSSKIPSTSSHTPNADLRRSTSFSSPRGGDGSYGPTATSTPGTPIRS